MAYHHHDHHHVTLVARISLTLSRHSSLSFIAPGRSSGQHPVSSHSCWMYVRAGRPAFARPRVGVHKSTSLMSSSLLLQQCPACLVCLTWIVFVIGGKWPYGLVACGVLPLGIWWRQDTESFIWNEQKKYIYGVRQEKNVSHKKERKKKTISGTNFYKCRWFSGFNIYPSSSQFSVAYS